MSEEFALEWGAGHSGFPAIRPWVPATVRGGINPPGQGPAINGHNRAHVATMADSDGTPSSTWKPMLLNGSSTIRAQ